MNTKSNIPDEVQAFYDRNLLTRAIANFVYLQFAQIRDIKNNAGTMTIKFRRYGNLTAATTALTEGVTPAGSSLSVTDITATVLQYGDYVTVSDVVDFSSEDAVLTEAGEILGDQASDTFDQLARDTFCAGTNIYYGGSGHTLRSQVASGENITDTLIKKAVRLLKKNKTRFITSLIDASNGYNTSPLKAGFIGICHTDTTTDLEGITGWIPVEKYAQKKDVMDHEIGAYGNVRFIETPNAKIFAGAGTGPIDVYATLIFGKDAFGISRISGKTLENIIKPLGSGGTSDPLNQRATSGWKGTFVAKILNDAFMVRLEHAVSA